LIDPLAVLVNDQVPHLLFVGLPLQRVRMTGYAVLDPVAEQRVANVGRGSSVGRSAAELAPSTADGLLNGRAVGTKVICVICGRSIVVPR
jgi:hypothetical protein